MKKKLTFFLIALALLMFLGLCCEKQPDGITGTWVRYSPDITYHFFDDSRFQQSDHVGKQWVWEQIGNDVYLHGTPERVLCIEFREANEALVIEQDTFVILRK